MQRKGGVYVSRLQRFSSDVDPPTEDETLLKKWFDDRSEDIPRNVELDRVAPFGVEARLDGHRFSCAMIPTSLRHAGHVHSGEIEIGRGAGTTQSIRSHWSSGCPRKRKHSDRKKSRDIERCHCQGSGRHHSRRDRKADRSAIAKEFSRHSNPFHWPRWLPPFGSQPRFDIS